MSTCHLIVTDWVFFLGRKWSLQCIACAQLLYSHCCSIESFTFYKIISQRILLFHVWRYLMKKINWFCFVVGSFCCILHITCDNQATKPYLTPRKEKNEDQRPKIGKVWNYKLQSRDPNLLIEFHFVNDNANVCEFSK